MSVNRHGYHLLVLPEDDANRQIANGFRNHHTVVLGSIQILNEDRGWTHARDTFLKKYIGYMRKYDKCVFLFLIDFDRRENRLASVMDEIPNDLKDRVFVLGTESEPENLCSAVGKKSEPIGMMLAEECAYSKHELWNHPLLQHNQLELIRMKPLLKSFLFQNR